MIISLNHKILFFHISKTAGTSISLMLENICDDAKSSFNKIFLNNIHNQAVRHIKDKLDLMQSNRYPFTHITQTDARPFLQLSNIDTSDFSEFIIVRNPYDRLKSQMIYQKLNEQYSVDHFLNRFESLNSSPSGYWFCRQMEYIKDPITKNLQIYKYEELNKLWPFLANIKPYKPFVVQRVNETANKKDVKIEFTLAQKKRIYHMWRESFEYLGYPKGF